MSGHSYNTICPNCKGENLEVSMDTKPCPIALSQCVDCGFASDFQFYFMDLEEVNSCREEAGMKKLKKLPKQNKDLIY